MLKCASAYTVSISCQLTSHTIVVFIFARDKFSLFSRFVPNPRKFVHAKYLSRVYPRLAGSGRSPCCYWTALLRYFKPVNRQANLDVLSVEKRDASAKTRAWGSYGRLTDKQRAKIGKYASENGNAAAVRRFSKELDRPRDSL